MDLTGNPGATDLDLTKAPLRRIPSLSLSIHRYLPFAAFYFFFNAAGLPTGLFYTTLFSPFLYVWLNLKGHRRLTAKFLLILSPFLLAHLIIGVTSPIYYLRSLLLLWSVYIAAFSFCWALTKSSTIDRLFDQLILLNFLASIIAIIALPTPLRLVFWHDDAITIVGASHVLRLDLLCTEPSAYSLLMLPLLIFSALRLLGNGNMRNCTYLCMIAIPFLLCQSFGGISMCLAALGVSIMTSYRRLFKRANSLIILACSAIVLAALLGTHNQISERVLQVATGGDPSSKSRTIFSFVAAYAVASSKSIWWGAGLGQGKLIDLSDLGIGFEVNVIPNAVAGTFAELGLIGVLFRLAAECYLFVKTKTYLSTFRLAMFVVAFITQWTGSYLTDVQEYILWFLAFYPVFPDSTLPGQFHPETAVSANRVSRQC
jgi:hypothetical protein